MSCDRYWKEGVVLVERGELDPHLASCADCRREHRAREEMIRAMPLIGAGGGDPLWQERVWSRIAMQRATDSRSRMAWRWGSALVAVAAVLALWGRAKPPERDANLLALLDRPDYELVRIVETRSGDGSGSGSATRSELGQELTVWGRASEDVRIYLSEKLLLRCGSGLSTVSREAASGSRGHVFEWAVSLFSERARAEMISALESSCIADESQVTAKLLLTMPGDYRLLTFPVEASAGKAFAERLPGTWTRDVDAILDARMPYKMHELPVR